MPRRVDGIGAGRAIDAIGIHQRWLPGVSFGQGSERARGRGDLLPRQRGGQWHLGRAERARRHLAAHVAAEPEQLRGQEISQRRRLSLAPAPGLPDRQRLLRRLAQLAGRHGRPIESGYCLAAQHARLGRRVAVRDVWRDAAVAIDMRIYLAQRAKADTVRPTQDQIA